MQYLYSNRHHVFKVNPMSGALGLPGPCHLFAEAAEPPQNFWLKKVYYQMVSR